MFLDLAGARGTFQHLLQLRSAHLTTDMLKPFIGMECVDPLGKFLLAEQLERRFAEKHASCVSFRAN